MKKRYRMHPEDYAIGENEAFYAAMAAKGLRLVKRGSRFSRFEVVEPERLRYRIELSTPELFGDTGLPEEQISVYEECGWKFVTSCGLVHVFCAPENSEAPEFYENPEQQAGTLKALRRNCVGTAAWSFLLIVLYVVMTGLLAGGAGIAGKNFLTGLYRLFTETTALVLLLLCLAAGGLYEAFYAFLRVGSLYRRMKKGIPLDHTPKKRRRVHKGISAAFVSLFLVFLVLTMVQQLGRKKYEMPLVSEGDYLLLSDLGWEGERMVQPPKKETSSVVRERSLVAEHISTYECVGSLTSDSWLYQDCYRLRSDKAAQDYARVLMNSALFTAGPEEFRPFETEGLDLAYAGRLEYIAVKGKWVCYAVYSGSLVPDKVEEDGKLLSAYAKLLADH